MNETLIKNKALIIYKALAENRKLLNDIVEASERIPYKGFDQIMINENKIHDAFAVLSKEFRVSEKKMLGDIYDDLLLLKKDPNHDLFSFSIELIDKEIKLVQSKMYESLVDKLESVIYLHGLLKFKAQVLQQKNN